LLAEEICQMPFFSGAEENLAPYEKKFYRSENNT